MTERVFASMLATMTARAQLDPSDAKQLRVLTRKIRAGEHAVLERAELIGRLRDEGIAWQAMASAAGLKTHRAVQNTHARHVARQTANSA